MAHLTKPTKYNIEDSNIALLGSDLEKRVREHGGDTEPAWDTAGKQPGIQIWRVEQFKIKAWDRIGEFFNGDSYIVLNSYKADPDSEVLSYDLHFWLGEDTSQDEAGTAAYKTVELDDHLHGKPVQYREVEDYESSRFLSYFPRLTVLVGGTQTGFRHISSPPPLDLFNLYHISSTSSTPTSKASLVVRQITRNYQGALKQYSGDVFVLDKGTEVWQYNTKKSSGKERFKAAEVVRGIADADERKDKPEVRVFDEGGQGASTFLTELKEEDAEGQDRDLENVAQLSLEDDPTPKLFRITDASGQLSFVPLPQCSKAGLNTSDAFLLDNSGSKTAPAVYAWIGKEASQVERRNAVQIAQNYLSDGTKGGKRARVTVVRIGEGSETKEFFDAIGA